MGEVPLENQLSGPGSQIIVTLQCALKWFSSGTSPTWDYVISIVLILQTARPLLLMIIQQWPVYSPHEGSVKQKLFPFDDIIILTYSSRKWILCGWFIFWGSVQIIIHRYWQLHAAYIAYNLRTRKSNKILSDRLGKWVTWRHWWSPDAAFYPIITSIGKPIQ